MTDRKGIGARCAKQPTRFVGTNVTLPLHGDYSRLCRLAGRSMARDMVIALEVRVQELRKQEREGTIRGTRRI